jgi:hypothetical protein
VRRLASSLNFLTESTVITITNIKVTDASTWFFTQLKSLYEQTKIVKHRDKKVNKAPIKIEALHLL